MEGIYYKSWFFNFYDSNASYAGQKLIKIVKHYKMIKF